MAGPDMEAIEKGNLMITRQLPGQYMNPEDARDSLVIKKLNPTQLLPDPEHQRPRVLHGRRTCRRSVGRT